MHALLALLVLVPAVVSLQIPRDDETQVTIPITVRIDVAGSVNLPDSDRARARLFAAGGLPVPVKNIGITYMASVGVGSPSTTYNLLIDTGSSNTWLGAHKKYRATSTSHKTINNVSVSYGSGSFSGAEYIDRVSLAPRLVVDKQSIGVADQAQGFSDGIDGILGIGPAHLTVGTLSPSDKQSVPTITDNLFQTGAISSNQIGISFEPTNSPPAKNGELTFGGIDSRKVKGKITYVPITKTQPAAKYWGVEQSIRYGGKTTILPKTAGIVDTGTTLILLATSAFNAYAKATGGVFDNATGLLKLTKSQFGRLESLFFVIGGTTYELTPNAQAWPRALNREIQGDSDSVYLIVSDLGTNASGLGFLNGFTFLERFYTVYDSQNHRVGFANTHFTHANTN